MSTLEARVNLVIEMMAASQKEVIQKQVTGVAMTQFPAQEVARLQSELELTTITRE